MATYLLKEGEWPQVMNHETVMTIIIHQCRLGLKGAAGLPIKKPTVLVSDGRILLEQFTNLQCRNDHQHDQTWGNGKLLHSLQVWPWGLAERLINGIVALIKQLKQANNYPELGTGHQDDDVQDDETQPWIKCPGCKGRMARTRREHTRTRGECKWPMWNLKRNGHVQAAPGHHHEPEAIKITRKSPKNAGGDSKALET